MRSAADRAVPAAGPLARPHGDPDPYPNYAWLREHAPVAPASGRDGAPVWLVSRYDLARDCLADPRLSADHRNAASPPRSDDPLEHNLQGTDPPEHARLRRLVAAAFSPRAVEAARPMIARVCRQAVAAFADRGRAELVADYALVVPVAVIHELLGVPPEEQEAPAVCLDRFWRASVAEPPDPASGRYLDDYLRRIVALKRRRPGADLVTMLLGLLDRGELRDEGELRSMLYLLLGAGHATSVPFLAAGMLRLLEHPDQLAALRRDPAGWPACVEEVLRHDPASQASSNRYALSDLTVGGVAVSRGDTVLVSLAAANRDPDRFPDPDRFDSTRPPGPHLAFGHGAHFCLGAHLARAEGEIALRTLVATLPDLALAVDPRQVQWALGPMLRGPRALPVTFTPAGPA